MPEINSLEGVNSYAAIEGYSLLDGDGENIGMFMLKLDDFAERDKPGLSQEEILETVKFVDKIIFGRTNYSKEISAYPDCKNFYNSCAEQVIKFCEENKISYHIKSGTITE